MIKNIIKNTDFISVAIVLALTIIGIFAIYSANYNSETGQLEYIKQIVWFVAGAGICIGVIAVGCNNMGKISFLLAPVFLLLLVGVLFTPSIANAHSWYRIGGQLFQPSEAFKIFYILCMARLIEYISQKDSKGINRFTNLCIVLGIAGAIFGLIAIQPDFGTAFVYIVITAFMIFRAGIDYRYILVMLLIVAILVPITYFVFLSEGQKDRIKVFLDPTLDPLGSGYHLMQSKIAVGSGMFKGTGYLKGTQTQFDFLPVKSSDFIFSVIAEELGFIGAGSVILLFGILLMRIIYISMTSEDYYGSLVCVGILGMFFFHYLENIGMTMGIVPITGIPLPFVSYGGSSMLTNMLSFGIVLAVSARRKIRR